jgi:hypothetical protein
MPKDGPSRLMMTGPSHSKLSLQTACRVFLLKNLTRSQWNRLWSMADRANLTRPTLGASASIRQRIESSGERLWRMEDFQDLPFAAVAQALSRLTRAGLIERLSKGIYYRHRPTALGQSRPQPTKLQQLAVTKGPIFPSGLAAANLLGFSTQSAGRAEVATSKASLPRKLLGGDALIHAHRPDAWARLTEWEGALLDFLRRGGQHSEFSPAETCAKVLYLLQEPGRFEKLLEVAATEPPRVRALLGALGERLGKPAELLRPLRDSLNPYSRFNFGILSVLPNAKPWQAKEQHS